MELLVLAHLHLWVHSLQLHRHPPKGTCLHFPSSRELGWVEWEEWELQSNSSRFNSKVEPCLHNTISISFSKWVVEVEGG